MTICEYDGLSAEELKRELQILALVSAKKQETISALLEEVRAYREIPPSAATDLEHCSCSMCRAKKISKKNKDRGIL